MYAKMNPTDSITVSGDSVSNLPRSFSEAITAFKAEIEQKVFTYFLSQGKSAQDISKFSALPTEEKINLVTEVRRTNPEMATMLHLFKVTSIANPETKVDTLVSEMLGQPTDDYLTQLFEDLSQDEDFTDEELNLKAQGLFEEITANTHINNELKISKELKFKLSLIPWGKTFLKFKYVYARTIDLLQDIDPAADVVRALTIASGKSSGMSKALIDEISKLYTKANRRSINAGGKSFSLQEDFEFYSFEGEKSVFKYKETTLHQRQKESNRAFFDRILDTIQVKKDKAGYEYLSGLMEIGFAKDMIRKLTSELGSQIKNNPWQEQTSNFDDNPYIISSKTFFMLSRLNSATKAEKEIRKIILSNLNKYFDTKSKSKVNFFKSLHTKDLCSLLGLNYNNTDVRYEAIKLLESAIYFNNGVNEYEKMYSGYLHNFITKFSKNHPSFGSPVFKTQTGELVAPYITQSTVQYILWKHIKNSHTDLNPALLENTIYKNEYRIKEIGIIKSNTNKEHDHAAMLSRRFLFGFLASLYHNKKDLHYFHYLTNNHSIIGLRIKILNNTETRNAYCSFLSISNNLGNQYEIENTMRINSHKIYEDFKKQKKTDLLKTFIIFLRAEDLSRLSNSVLQFNEAEKILERYDHIDTKYIDELIPVLETKYNIMDTNRAMILSLLKLFSVFYYQNLINDIHLKILLSNG